MPTLGLWAQWESHHISNLTKWDSWRRWLRVAPVYCAVNISTVLLRGFERDDDGRLSRASEQWRSQGGGDSGWRQWPERVIISCRVNVAEIGLFCGSSRDGSKPEWSGWECERKRIVAARRLKVKHRSVPYLFKWTICSLWESSDAAEPKIHLCLK